MMLRSKCGKKWYKLLEFKHKLPDKLKIEAVIVLCKKDEDKFKNEIKKFIDYEFPISMEADQIIPWVAYYDEKSFNITQVLKITEEFLKTP